MVKYPLLGQLVSSASGRDRGHHYLVVGQEADRVLVADGARRKLEDPKRKNPLHLQWRRERDRELGEKLEADEKVTNSELRGALIKLLELENNMTPSRGGEEKLG